MNKKMADVDIDPFGEHDRTEEPTDENILLSPVTPGRSSWNWNMNKKHHSEEESLKEPN